MKYFSAYGEDYHCDDTFNWMAVDKDGEVYLYQNEPFARLEQGYWSSGHTDSYDHHVYTEIAIPYHNWLHSLVRL